MEVDDAVEKASSQEGGLGTCAPAHLSSTTLACLLDEIQLYSLARIRRHYTRATCFAVSPCPRVIRFNFGTRTKWVESQIANAPHGVKDRFGLIVFVGGNNQQVPAHQRIFTYEPVRFCTVKEVFFDYDTQQLVTILELEQFVKCQFNAREKPPNFFVTSGEIAKYEPTTWLECVQRLQP